ncbi:anaphase-promoting complex subunit cdc27 [Kickxella alabastrina]|uniref:Anaphase-promoting complex subunit cdc27 n=1 Tax=Kickxella alabastrina TaxID=61397 RepID=A0ACC1I871_9FUNG|nr:anaphase-promoting complex subunit cdc27 [Kickxella alabastrina]
MLSQTADTPNNRHRASRPAGRAPTASLAMDSSRNATGVHKPAVGKAPQATNIPLHPCKEAQFHSESHSTPANATQHMTRPHNESARCYYEALISRGISLLQPYSVLFIAEAYHGWFHAASVDVAGSILQQTIGYQREHSQQNSDSTTSSFVGDASGDGLDVRSIYWLALCYWHLGEVSTVYALLGSIAVESEFIIDQCDADPEAAGTAANSSGQHGLVARESPKLRSKKALACGMWLLAMSCTRLEKWQEAEDHLTALSGILRLIYPPDEPGKSRGADTSIAIRNAADTLYAVPTLADVSDLLGLVCLRTNRAAQSEQHSADALRRNPLSWSSCRRLCDLGNTQKLSQSLLGSLNGIGAELQTQSTNSINQGWVDNNTLESTPIPVSRISTKGILSTAAVPPSVIPRKAKLSARLAATGQLSQPSRIGTANAGDPAANGRPRTRLVSQTLTSGSNSGGNNSGGSTSNTTVLSSSNSSNLPGNRTKVTALALRSGLDLRQEAQARSASSIPTRTPARARPETLLTADRKRLRNGVPLNSTLFKRSKEAESVNATTAATVDAHALSHIHQLVRVAGTIFAHAQSYQAPQALAAFAELSAEHQNSAWGLCLLGRICFEAGRYPESAHAFGAAHQLAPYRTRDMDIYSTLLWHTKNEEALAQLAQTMVSAGRNWSPEAWIAVANCFSLDGDHESALKSLGRGIQLFKAAHGGTMVVPRNESGGVSGLAYAHTLVGHENVAGEDLDRAQQAFRTAIRIDSRHYNAWYGLGMVYLRLGKLDLSEYHFKRALTLNPHNPLLLQSAGAVYEHRGDYPSALEVYTRVERLLESGHSANIGMTITGNGMVVLGLQSHYAMNFVMFKRARVLVVLERFSEAASILEKLTRRCPHEFNVPFLLGQTYAKLHRYREAAACLTRALDIAPENSQSVTEAFDALYQQSADGQENIEPDQENSDADLPGQLLHTRSNRDLRTPTNSGFGRNGEMLSPTSSVESSYFGSPPPPLYARGRRGRAEWSHDWSALSSADNRIERAMDFDI